MRTGAWSQRLRPLGQTVTWHHVCKAVDPLSSSHRCCCSSVGVHTGFPGVSHHSAQVYLACAPVTSAVCMSSPYHPSWPWCRCMIRWQRAIAGPVAGLCFCVCVFPGCAVSLVSPRPGLSHASRDHGSIPLASLWPVPAAFCLCQPVSVTVTAVGFEPTPLRTGAWSQRLRPLGQTVMWHHVCKAVQQHGSSHRCCCSSVGVHTGFPGVSHHSAQVYLHAFR